MQKKVLVKSDTYKIFYILCLWTICKIEAMKYAPPRLSVPHE